MLNFLKNKRKCCMSYSFQTCSLSCLLNITSMERLSYVETVIIGIHALAYDVCHNIIIYTLHDLNSLTTDQGAL